MKKNFWGIKKLLAVISVAIVTSAVFAGPRPLTDEEANNINYICHIAGITGLQGISQKDTYQAIEKLNQINTDKLSTFQQKIYDRILHQVQKNGTYIYEGEFISAGGGTELSPALYKHKNTENHEPNKQLIPYNEFKSGINVHGWVDIADHAFGYCNMQMQPRLDTDFYERLQYDNIPKPSNVEQVLPFSTGISIGNNWVNLMIARDKLHMDNGYSGNIGLGNNFVFQDFIKAGVHKGFFSYDILLDFFDRTPESAGKDNNLILDQTDFSGPYQYLVIHRFDFDFKKVSFGLYEAALMYTDGFDPRALNPFMVLHNYYNFRHKDQCNNFFGITIDTTPVKGWNIHLQTMIDQIQSKSEYGTEVPKTVPPNTYAGLINTSVTFNLRKQIVNLYAEGVYTSPCFGLKAKLAHTTDSEGNVTSEYSYNSDLIVGNCLTFPYRNLQTQTNYLGYIYGPNAIVCSAGISITDTKNYELYGKFSFMLHGDKGIGYGNGIEGETIGEMESNISPTVRPGFEIEKTFSVTAGIKLSLGKWVTVSTELGYLQMLNKYNKPGLNINDMQMMISCSIDPFRMIFD